MPQVLMKWKEPVAFSEIQHKVEPKRNYWPWIILSILWSIVLVILGCLKVFLFNQPMPSWMIWAPTVMVLPGLMIQYLINYRVPVSIIVWNRWISRYSWGTPQTPAYTELKNYSVHETQDYRILELTTLKEEAVLIGIPLDVDIQMLEGILSEHGVPKRAKD